MNVMIAYPPLPSSKGVPLLSQNRQFQWFNRPTYIYPMSPAYAATMAKEAGHDVLWADGIAEKWTPEEFEKRYAEFAPDVCLIETKTPVIKAHWRIVRRLKDLHPAGLIALCGDHVTALPEESLRNSPADFVLTGGDYDFTLLDLLAALESPPRTPTPPHPHTPSLPPIDYSLPSATSAPPREISLPPGLYCRNGNDIAHTPPFELTRDLNELPMLDRDLTRWELYARENGNFKYTPGTYTMVGRDCWWGKCTFCSWTTIYSNWRTRSPGSLLDEVGALIDRYGVREIFDDTGCFPAGKWLREFCEGMIERGYHKRVVMGCNMIPGVLDQDLYNLMGKANFRFVLFGLESADQATLDRINKCGKAGDIENSMRMAKAAGLEPHVTCMVGYPWETREQAEATVNRTKDMFRAGHIDSLQATVVIPYPGTPLFKECDEKGWLKTKDWDRYDMREPVMKTEMTDEEVLSLTRGIYKSFLTPRFFLRKLLAIRSLADVAFYWRAARRVLGHLLDFRG